MATILTLLIPAILGAAVALLWRAYQWRRHYTAIDAALSVHRPPEKLNTVTAAPAAKIIEQ